MPKIVALPINIDMKLISILLSIVLLCVLVTPAQAGHSQGNGTCEDDITHWSNMIGKRTDAPLYEQSKEMAKQAQLKASVWQCETFMEEAIRMI